MSRTLYLLGCSKTKAPSLLPAKELYQGDLFRLARRYIEGIGAEWLILSAKHGLLLPDDIISPYDDSLQAMTREQRQAWGLEVWTLGGLRDRMWRAPLLTSVVFLCGKLYREQLVCRVRRCAGIVVDVPMAGLGIGAQKRWLHTQMAGGAA